MKLGRIAGLVLGGLVALAATGAQAQSDWPNRPVKLVVPFGAGGSGDLLARLVADHLGSVFKQQFVVENRTGAGGTLGVQVEIGRAHV